MLLGDVVSLFAFGSLETPRVVWSEMIQGTLHLAGSLASLQESVLLE